MSAVGLEENLLKPSAISRFYAALILVTFVNGALFTVLKEGEAQGLVQSILSGGSVNPILLFSLFCVVWWIWSGDVPLTPLKYNGDMFFLPIMALLVLIPLEFFSWIALTLIGIRISLNFRTFGLLVAYLSVPLFWGKLIIKVIGLKLLWLDAIIVSIFTGRDFDGNYLLGTDDNQPLLILWGCSSFHGVNYLVLAWLTFSFVNKAPPSRRLWLFPIGLVGMFVINWIRLILLAEFDQYFDFLHTGFGSQIIAIITMIWILLICFLSGKESGPLEVKS